MADLAAKIAAINARIEGLTLGGGNTARTASSSQSTQSTPRNHPVLSVSAHHNVSEFDRGTDSSDDGFDDSSTVKSDVSGTSGSTIVAVSNSSSSNTVHKVNNAARALCPSDVAEDLDIEFLDKKRRHRFPSCGITVKATSTSTYNGVNFIECSFDAYEGTTFDDCVLDDVIFTKCHFRGTSIIKLVARGVRFTGCVFGQTHFDGRRLIEDAVILNESFAFDRVIRGPTADDSKSVRISAIMEFEVIKNGKNQQPRQHVWADEKDNKAVQGDGQLVEAPVYAGWENKVVQAAAPGDLLSFDEPLDFEEAEAQARSELMEKNGVIVPKNPNWNRQFIRQHANAVKLVDREAEDAADAKTFAPTNFVTLDFNADPETRKEEITDNFVIGKREYYGTKNGKSKRYWGERKAEQQQNRRRNIAGAPHFY